MKQLAELKGIGKLTIGKLAQIGITSLHDLIWNFPRKYEDYSEVSKIAKLKPGQVTIQCKVTMVKGRYVRRGMHITEAILSDETDSTRAVWFNQPYRASSIKSDQLYFVSGKYELSRQKFAVMNPSMELVSNFPLNTARIIPVYRETKGLRSSTLRKLLAQIRPEILDTKEILPSDVVEENKLMSRGEALTQIHFPSDSKSLAAAHYRLGFEEVYGVVLAAQSNKKALEREAAPKVKFDEKLARSFVAKLPYKLTDAQRKVAWQIYKDMERSVPMNRLIEGDVGSGKTVVATMSATLVMSRELQVAFMAPTELLARQHADTLRKLLSTVGLDKEVALLVGSMSEKEKKEIRSLVAGGLRKILVGTHALITDKVDMHNLALVIVDEQHRFGVAQRQKLQKKAGHMPHTLSMTATPIPRTLALTLYGDLDISVLDEKPSNRSIVKTEIISPNSRKQLYQKVDDEIESGKQVFVVCPLITDSDSVSTLSVESVYDQLKKATFKHRKVGLLHGKMKSVDKDAVMKSFVDREIDILVSTTVVEVGVDVPNATVMIIEGAERFGLAQMHQLRGRIGRSEHTGYCYLVMSDSNLPTKRLRAIEQSNNGFELAEMDLELRGPGAIYGHMQHGQLDLRIARLSDTALISAARQSANEFYQKENSLSDYPELKKHVDSYRAITYLN